MKVLITGATGFIGSHSVSAIVTAGHDVRLFVRRPERIAPALKPHGLTPADVDHVIGDVNDGASVRRALEGCEAVVHAGSAYVYALPFWKSSSLMTTNVEGTSNVLRLAHSMGMDPIVHVSSLWAIVQSGLSAVLTEETPPGDPPDPYPRSKVLAERIARDMQAAGAPIVITYPGGVWGPHDPHWGETAQLAESILRGRLNFVTGGTIPFSDVREVARLHAAVLEPGRGPRRYLVPSHSPRFEDAVRLVARAAGRELEPTVLPGRTVLWSMLPLRLAQTVSPFRLPLTYAGPWIVTRNSRYAESRAQKEFGIEPRPFEDSVRDTVQWMAHDGRLPASLFGPGILPGRISV